MAFQTGTATDLADLITQLNTFAVANGWTSDEINTGTGRMAMHRNTVYVSFRWDTVTTNALGIYQALGWLAATDPGNHTDDSGNGAVSGTDSVIDNERAVTDIGDGPFPYYAFFESDVYIHVVVETSTDVFRHFGFGEIIKTGDWTGGEYCYGHHHGANTALTTSTSAGLDALFSDVAGVSERRAATLHMEGFANQPASGKWGQVWGRADSAPNDRAGNGKAHVQGGHRGGPIGYAFGWLNAGNQSGLIPMYPISLFYRDTTDNDVEFLGFQPDVRGCNIKNFAPKDEVVIGADTWVFYPTSQKTLTATADRTYNQGIAYKKVTT